MDRRMAEPKSWESDILLKFYEDQYSLSLKLKDVSHVLLHGNLTKICGNGIKAHTKFGDHNFMQTEVMLRYFSVYHLKMCLSISFFGIENKEGYLLQG